MAQTRIYEAKIDPHNPSVKLQLIREQLTVVMRNFLSHAAQQAADAAKKKALDLAKADGPDEPWDDQIARSSADAITWDRLIEDVRKELLAAAESGATDGIVQLELIGQDIYDVANRIAANYAEQRSAEMVGRQIIEGRLVDNPDAQWNIAETTREDIRKIVADAFTRKSSAEGIATDILQATTFGAKRADMIARTEIATAQIRSNLEIWRQTGMVRSVRIVLSALHDVYDDCDDAAEGSPYSINEVPLLPLHPYCRCGLVAVEIVE